MRIFAVSDIHVDYPDNMAWIKNLSCYDYQNDALILGGDVSHLLTKLEITFELLISRFHKLFFVPGNHELWCHNGEHTDSLDKFHYILTLCQELNIYTKAQYLAGITPVWIVPLFSWYTKPEQGRDSLYLPKSGEDVNLTAWTDNYLVKWPDDNLAANPAAYFLALNEKTQCQRYEAPVITFSHFLPRADLIRAQALPVRAKKQVDPHPSFNFSRVAGTHELDRQLRQLQAVIHVYGHQHRNRYRLIDGVLYISHCLGYVAERARGVIQYLNHEPRLIWDTESSNAYGNPDIIQARVKIPAE